MKSGRATFLILLALGLFLAPMAPAQHAEKVYRIGFLSASSPTGIAYGRKALSQGMRDLGWLEGRDVVIEERYAEGQYERLSALTAELIRLRVDVIVASNIAARAAREATSTIPIVMTNQIDPEKRGLVVTLQRPGGNVTGMSWDPGPRIVEKNLQLLKEVVPNLHRVGVIIDPDHEGIEVYRRAQEEVAPQLGLALYHAEVREPKDIPKAFALLKRAGATALFVYGSPFIGTRLSEIVDLATSHRLPAIHISERAVALGLLMSYGPDGEDLFRRAASFVDKILKGAKPADLPAEQPTKFLMAINLKTAKALGLTVPPSLLLRADQVIE